MTETAVRLKSIGVTEEVVTDLTAAFARALCRITQMNNQHQCRHQRRFYCPKLKQHAELLLMTTARQGRVLNQIFLLSAEGEKEEREEEEREGGGGGGGKVGEVNWNLQVI